MINKIYITLLALFLAACSPKIEGTYWSDSSALGMSPELSIGYTFKSNGTFTMSVGSTTPPGEYPYVVNGNQITIPSRNGEQIITILEDGDLLLMGLRLSKKNAVKQSEAISAIASAKESEAAKAIAIKAELTAAVKKAPLPELVQTEKQKTWTPSFDCNKASNFAEKSICKEPLLGNLDGALSENYTFILFSNIGDSAKNDLKATQKNWLLERNKCFDSKCLENIHRKRIDEVCEYPVLSGVHPICTNAEDIR
jgi:uncharacterized protein YecT (DUF1311 family)